MIADAIDGPGKPMVTVRLEARCQDCDIHENGRYQRAEHRIPDRFPEQKSDSAKAQWQRKRRGPNRRGQTGRNRLRSRQDANPFTTLTYAMTARLS